MLEPASQQSASSQPAVSQLECSSLVSAGARVLVVVGLSSINELGALQIDDATKVALISELAHRRSNYALIHRGRAKIKGERKVVFILQIM